MHFFRKRKLFKKLKYFVVLLIGLFILIRNKSNYLLKNIKNDSKSFDYCQLPELNSNNNHNTSLPGNNYIYFFIYFAKYH